MEVILIIKPIIPAELKRNALNKHTQNKIAQPELVPRIIVAINIGISEKSSFKNGADGIIGNFINIPKTKDIKTVIELNTVFNIF